MPYFLTSMKPFFTKNSYIDTIKKLQMEINYKL